MSKSPCKNCTERYVGCHSKCKPYIEFTQILVAYREAKEYKGDVIGYVKDSNIRIRRRANKPVRAWQELGLRKPHKRRLSRTDIDVNELIRLRNEGLTIRAIAAKCGASFCAVRKRLLNAGVKLERLK